MEGLVPELADGHRPQSSSASRITAVAFGFLLLGSNAVSGRSYWSPLVMVCSVSAASPVTGAEAHLPMGWVACDGDAAR